MKVVLTRKPFEALFRNQEVTMNNKNKKPPFGGFNIGSTIAVYYFFFSTSWSWSLLTISSPSWAT
jgi:hypothetical protein